MRDPDAELGERTRDPEAPHLGFSLPCRRMSSRTSPAIAGLPPADLRRKGSTSVAPTPGATEMSVCGHTTNDDHRAGGSILLIAAMNCRSRRRRRGGPAWRLSTINWCRRATTSTLVFISSLEEPAINRSTRRSNRYARAKSTRGHPTRRRPRWYERAGRATIRGLCALQASCGTAIGAEFRDSRSRCTLGVVGCSARCTRRGRALMTPAEDEDVVEALPSSGAHPALRERVRPRRADGRRHHRESFRTEDIIEGAEELQVSISGQDVLLLETSPDREVPSLLSDPSGVGSAARAGHMDPSGGAR